MENTGSQKDIWFIYFGIMVVMGFCFAELIHLNGYFLNGHHFENHLATTVKDVIVNSTFIQNMGIAFRVGYILIMTGYVWAINIIQMKEGKNPSSYVFLGFSVIILLIIGRAYSGVSAGWQLIVLDCIYIFSLFAYPFALIDIKGRLGGGQGFEFRQNRGIQENELSISWKTQDGRVNILEPQRGISVIGGNGSGKSYTIIEESMKQLLTKGVTAMIYDFKFPTLSEYAFSCMCRWGWETDELGTPSWNKNKIPRMVYYINFKDIRYSHRCNAITPKMMDSIAMAGECATTILCNLNREWIKKRGFFEDSAIVLFTAVLWYNRKYNVMTGKPYSSLPHAIAFCTLSDEYIIPILLDDFEIRASVAAVASAFTKGAATQYAGVVGTLQNSIGKLNIPELFYVMTEDENDITLPREKRISFNLDINNPVDPKVVCLGNDNNLSQILAPALSLYASVISKQINQQGKMPSLFCVDEAPTLYIPKLDNLPNTGRSNKVITLLAAQDYGQYDRDYGKEESRVIKAGLGNIFIGEVGDEETAKVASGFFGKKHMAKTSTTVSDNGMSKQYSTNLEEVFPADMIMGMSTGEFAGKVTGTPKRVNKNKNEDIKLFKSKFIVTKETDINKEDYDPTFLQKLPIVLNMPADEVSEMLFKNQQKIYDEVEIMAQYELSIVKAKAVWKTKDEKIFKDENKSGNARKKIEANMPKFLEVLNLRKSEFKTEPEAITKLTKEFFEPLF